jgi:hypothetical protein
MNTARFRLQRIESVGVVLCGFLFCLIPVARFRALYLATRTVNNGNALEDLLVYRQFINIPFVLITFGIVLFAMGWYWRRFEFRQTFPWIFVGTTLPLTVLLSIPNSGFLPLLYPIFVTNYAAPSSFPDALAQVLIFIVTLSVLVPLTFLVGKWRMGKSDQ